MVRIARLAALLIFVVWGNNPALAGEPAGCSLKLGLALAGDQQAHIVAIRQFRLVERLLLENDQSPQAPVLVNDLCMVKLMGAASESKPQRLHCIWPKQPRLQAGVNLERASSYDCT